MLVEQHAPRMYRLAAAIVGSADAADVAQESFVTAWQRLPTLRDAAAFDGWLRRICVNRARNWLRDRGRRPRIVSGAEGEAEQVRDRAADFHGSVEARSLLEPAFERLGANQRAILALHYSMGLTIAQTAAALGIRQGTAKSRLSAALAALRHEVQHPLRQVETEDIGSEATS